MRPPNRLLELLGFDVALQLHVASTKFPIHYMVYSQAIIPLSEMGNGILNRNQTTWGNTDTRLSPVGFYETTVSHRISTHELAVMVVGGP